MVSIIVCSYNPDNLKKFKQNIADTIGNAEYEIISFDNRKEKRPLSEVYNQGAGKAKFDNLLFAHEDAGFLCTGWTDIIEEKLREDSCGVIGIAGSKAVLDAPGGWNMASEWAVWDFTECGVKKSQNHDSYNAFTSVAAIDGYMMFVKKNVWEKHPFDQKLLTAFHCYDMDFSLTLRNAGYINYVCNTIETYHNSEGSFHLQWIKETEKLYLKKWHRILPIYADGFTVSDKKRMHHEERAYFRFLKMLAAHNLPFDNWMPGFCKYPLTTRHIRHLLKIPFMRFVSKRRHSG